MRSAAPSIARPETSPTPEVAVPTPYTVRDGIPEYLTPSNVASVATADYPLNVSNWGPKAIYVKEDDPLSRTVRGEELRLVDLETGEDSVIVHTAERFQAPSIGPEGIVWLEVRIKETVRERRGSTNSNPAHWTLFHYDFSSGQITALDSGVGTRIIGRWAETPGVVMDGDTVAYDVERLIPGTKRFAATIRVRSLATGQLITEIDTDHPLASLAIKGTHVAYVQGIPPYGLWAGFRHPQVVLADLSGNKTILDDIPGTDYLNVEPLYDVALGDNVLAWWRPNGVRWVPLDDLTRFQGVTDEWLKPPLKAGEGLIYWPRYGVPIAEDPHDSSGYLDPSTGKMAAMYLMEVGDQPSIGGGWLTWMGSSVGEGVWHIEGMPVAELRQLFGWN